MELPTETRSLGPPPEAIHVPPEQIVKHGRPLEVYVCPQCPNYFGCLSMSDLDVERTGGRGMNGEQYPERSRLRSSCPDCFARTGEVVRRVRVTVYAPVDL